MTTDSTAIVPEKVITVSQAVQIVKKTAADELRAAKREQKTRVWEGTGLRGVQRCKTHDRAILAAYVDNATRCPYWDDRRKGRFGESQ